jgi:hypothetical protein
MSTVTRPRGPLPPRVYWTRRVLVLVVALGLVFAVAQLLSRGGGGADRPSAQPVGATASTTGSAPLSTADATPRAGASRQPVATASAKRTRKAVTRAPSPTPTPLATPSGPCVSSDVVTAPSLRAGRAYAGRSVVFSVTLTTKLVPACRWDVSADSLVVRVTSGDDRIWSTQECRGSVPKQAVVVRRDHPTTVSVAWNGQRSDAECTRTTPWAQPGYYHVTTAAFGAEPAERQFVLEAPPRPTITATPTPDGKKKTH